MNSRIKKGIVAAATAVAAAAALVVGTAGSSTAATPTLQAYGITGDGLTMAAFKTNTPQVLDWVQDITGLPSGNFAVGLDFRVQDGLLYIVDNQGAIYTVKVWPSPTGPVSAVKVSQLTVSLSGANFGVDFNPAADRLRVVSDNGQNLRHDLNTHTTIADLQLNTNGVQAKGVSAAGYTNNDLNAATGTTLFDINTVTDQVVIQSPPNNGSLVPTGSLGFDVGPNAGLDIFADLVNGKTVANIAFGSFTVNGVAGFYNVNLLTGQADPIGNFPRTVQITDAAVALDTV